MDRCFSETITGTSILSRILGLNYVLLVIEKLFIGRFLCGLRILESKVWTFVDATLQFFIANSWRL